MSLTTGVGSFKTGFNLAYRYIDGYPTFVGANAGLTNTAPMPSHQAHDMIVVFALNFDNNTIPGAPVNEGWISAHSGSSTGPASGGWRIAYKFAKSNTEVVGNWFTSDRIVVAVYRNARGVIGTAAQNVAALSNQITYPAADGPVIGSGGTRLLRFGISFGSDDAGGALLGHTKRIATTDVNGSSAPSTAIHDLEVDPASTYPSTTNAVAATGKTVGITLGIGYGTPPLTAGTATLDTTLNGDVLANTVLLASKGYSAELANVFTTYRSFFTCNGGSFSVNGSSVDTDLGFYLQAETGDFDYSLTDAFLQRALLFFPQSGSLTHALTSIDLPKGYFATPQTGVFSTAFANGGSTHSAFLAAERIQLDAATQEASLQRAIIEAFTGTTLSFSLSQVGIRNITASPAAGGSAGKPQFTHGGSSPSDPSFLQPQFVKFNSISKSKNLGSVNNFFGTISGEVGSEVGSPTLFFKMNILGSATLRISKNASNRYTDKQISIGILDSNRKQVQIDQFGFAYNNDNAATSEDEALDPLESGTYYFTVSSSQWQKIPYSISIQAISFKTIKGKALLTMQPSGRIAIAKLRGPALLSNGSRATIPSDNQLKRTTGHILVSSSSRGTLVIPGGVALMRDITTGRLKETHKISSVASLTGVNMATLSSEPPSYGGY
ncbi:MAG TPA: hypothetical protein DEP13_08050 [Gammaproteobacteria bacterium]|nr:MAG: hypothetical protein CBD74_05980 [Saprospirales bacterium TMED214]HCA36576.1 hypothetical protein [Gammaproteobacteria bacterium]